MHRLYRRGLLREISQRVGVLFPALDIERLNSPFSGFRLQASNVDIIPVGLRSRDIERLDPAGRAEVMVGYASIERVGSYILATVQEIEVRFRGTQVEKFQPRTNRALVVTALYFSGASTSKHTSPTMTAAHVNHGRLSPDRRPLASASLRAPHSCALPKRESQRHRRLPL